MSTTEVFSKMAIPGGVVPLVAHGAVFFTYVFCLYYESKNVTWKLPYTYAGRWKYLTFWNEVLQTVYFGIAVLNDLVGSNTKPWEKNWERRSSLEKARDYVLSSMAFPMGTFVVVTFWGLYIVDRELVHPKALDVIIPSWLNHVTFVVVTFWGLYAIDRDLVFPKVLDAIIPTWLNHVMHTTVLVFLLLDKFFVYHHYPSKRTGICTCVGFAAVYQIWIFWIAFHANIWVYPVLAVLSMPLRLVFLAVLWLFVISFYLLGQKLNSAMWDTKRYIREVKEK